jgi:hypothetical protein
MRIFGVDFTSAPDRRKPICVAACWLDGDRLTFERLDRLHSLDAFGTALRAPRPWMAGFDFPFTQSRKFLRNIGWPEDWTAYATLIGGMDRQAFRAALEAYKADRAPGDREHAREFERGSGAVSPQKLYGVPVALMQFEGAPRLFATGVHVPGLREGDLSRIAVEAYPGVAARALIGRRPYKNDQTSKQTADQAEARAELLRCLTGEPGRARFGLVVEAPPRIAEDPGADPLDALLCAVQAAWALRLMEREPGRLARLDLSGGWIADPDVLERLPLRGGP